MNAIVPSIRARWENISHGTRLFLRAWGGFLILASLGLLAIAVFLPKHG